MGPLGPPPSNATTGSRALGLGTSTRSITARPPARPAAAAAARGAHGGSPPRFCRSRCRPRRSPTRARRERPRPSRQRASPDSPRAPRAPPPARRSNRQPPGRPSPAACVRTLRHRAPRRVRAALARRASGVSWDRGDTVTSRQTRRSARDERGVTLETPSFAALSACPTHPWQEGHHVVRQCVVVRRTHGVSPWRRWLRRTAAAKSLRASRTREYAVVSGIP